MKTDTLALKIIALLIYPRDAFIQVADEATRFFRLRNLAKRLGISMAQARKYLKQLEQAGLIEQYRETKQGQAVVCLVTLKLPGQFLKERETYK